MKPVMRRLLTREPQGHSQPVGPEHMDPIAVLQEVLLRHLDDPTAEICEIEPMQARESPALEGIVLDRLEPNIRLTLILALQDVEETGRGLRAAVVAEIVEVLQGAGRDIYNGLHPCHNFL